MDDHGPDYFGLLEGHNYMSLATFRKNGSAVPTQVWFAECGGRLYVITERGSGKVKRIRNEPLATLAPCDWRGRVLGSRVEGRVVLLPPEESHEADRLLRRKYGVLYRGFNLFLKLTGRESERVFLEVAAPDDTREPSVERPD